MTNGTHKTDKTDERKPVQRYRRLLDAYHRTERRVKELEVSAVEHRRGMVRAMIRLGPMRKQLERRWERVQRFKIK